MRKHHLVAAAATLTLATPVTAMATSAEAAARCCPPRISVHVSDATPASGQTFHVAGRFLAGPGRPAAHRTVKVQTRRNDAWEMLRGARVSTTEEGRYRIRLVLGQRGHRLLRVVGVTREGQPNVARRLTVRVH